MNKIKSFCVDHTKLCEGIYLSRKDGDCNTYDLRFCKPNSGTVLDNGTMHTVEHMLATFTRNSEYADSIVYFGPMGCQTGFYLLVRDCVSEKEVLKLVKESLLKTVEHEGAVFGASEVECGNYRTLCLQSAKTACLEYFEKIKDVEHIKNYEEVNAEKA